MSGCDNINKVNFAPFLTSFLAASIDINPLYTLFLSPLNSTFFPIRCPKRYHFNVTMYVSMICAKPIHPKDHIKIMYL